MQCGSILRLQSWNEVDADDILIESQAYRERLIAVALSRPGANAGIANNERG